jgi:hypothetical protein
LAIACVATALIAVAVTSQALAQTINAPINATLRTGDEDESAVAINPNNTQGMQGYRYRFRPMADRPGHARSSLLAPAREAMADQPPVAIPRWPGTTTATCSLGISNELRARLSFM